MAQTGSIHFHVIVQLGLSDKSSAIVVFNVSVVQKIHHLEWLGFPWVVINFHDGYSRLTFFL